MTYFEPSKGLFLRILLIAVIIGTLATVIHFFVNQNGFFFTHRSSVGTPVVVQPVKNVCVRSGCSSELCLSKEDAKDKVSNCMYKASYACYQKATCETQSDGSCGWTQTPELKACLANPPALK